MTDIIVGALTFAAGAFVNVLAGTLDGSPPEK
jgi:hypothetical protein